MMMVCDKICNFTARVTVSRDSRIPAFQNIETLGFDYSVMQHHISAMPLGKPQDSSEDLLNLEQMCGMGLLFKF